MTVIPLFIKGLKVRQELPICSWVSLSPLSHYKDQEGSQRAEVFIFRKQSCPGKVCLALLPRSKDLLRFWALVWFHPLTPTLQWWDWVLGIWDLASGPTIKEEGWFWINFHSPAPLGWGSFLHCVPYIANVAQDCGQISRKPLVSLWAWALVQLSVMLKCIFRLETESLKMYLSDRWWSLLLPAFWLSFE